MRFTQEFSSKVRTQIENQTNDWNLDFWCFHTYNIFQCIYLVRARTIVRYNSLFEISERSQITIVARFHSPAAYMIHNQIGFYTKFDNRSIIFEQIDQVKNQLITGLTNGSLAYVNTKLALKADLIEFSKPDQNIYLTEQSLNLIHISWQLTDTLIGPCPNLTFCKLYRIL